MDIFSKLNKDKKIWQEFLAQKNIDSAKTAFDSYLGKLDGIKSEDKEILKKIDDEYRYSYYEFATGIWNLSQELFDNKDWHNALKCYQIILYYEDINTVAIEQLVICYKELNNTEKAREQAKILSGLEFETNTEYLKTAEFLSNQKFYAEAIETLNKYIDSRNGNVEAYYYSLLGCYYNSLYSQSGNLDDAKKAQEIFIKTAEMDSHNHNHLKNVIVMTFKTKDYDIGKKYWEKIFALGKLSERDKFDYSMFSLCIKDFKEHYKYWDSRFTCESVNFPKVNKPTWKGEDISDKTLLIYYEMGFGDNILAWGYIPRIVKRAKRVVFAAFHQLYELFSNNPHGIEIVKAGEIDLNTFDYDYIIPCMNISAVLGVDMSNISVGEKSITVREDLVQEFKQKYFNNDKLKIGIAFKGNVIGSHSRDIEIEKLLPLDELKNVEIYAFTKDVPDEAFNCFKTHKVHNIVQEFVNFEQTAAAIENCDVMVTTDNCIMNLAGALGKKTLGLFNHDFHYRWIDLSGESTVFFPSVKPFVNNIENNWNDSISRMMEDEIFANHKAEIATFRKINPESSSE